MKIISTQSLSTQPSWNDLVEELKAGHRLPRPQIHDTFLGDDKLTLLSRAALIEGIGCGVKTVTVAPGNSHLGLPSVQGTMLYFDPRTGSPEAMVDAPLITKWKTAADSVLGAKFLAKPDSTSLLIIGAGTVAESVACAYSSCFPSLNKISIYARHADRGARLIQRLSNIGVDAELTQDLAEACAASDIISTTTTSHDPVVFGSWIKPGTHVDLIGAFKANMREADDNLLQKSRLFVDCVDTTVEHIGELAIPLSTNAISRAHILGDLYDLVKGESGRRSARDVTVFKNGGGAHLDLMTARFLLRLSAHSNL